MHSTRDGDSLTPLAPLVEEALGGRRSRPPKTPLLILGLGVLTVSLLMVLAWQRVYADEAYRYFQAARALAAGRPAPLTLAPLYILLLALAARLGLPLPQTALALGALGWAVAVAAWLAVGWQLGCPAFGILAALLLALHPLQGRTLGLETGPALGLASLSLLLALFPHPTPSGFAATPSPLLTFGQERGGGAAATRRAARGVAAGGGGGVRFKFFSALFAFSAVGMMPKLALWAMLLAVGWARWRHARPTLAHLALGAGLAASLLALETALLGAWRDVRMLVPLSVALQILLAAGIATIPSPLLTFGQERGGGGPKGRGRGEALRPLALLVAVALCVGQANLLWQEWLLRPTDRLALYERVAQWVRASTLPTDRIGAPFPGLLGYLSDRDTLHLPGNPSVDDLQAFLESHRPDFLLAPSSLPWQLLQQQPWFQEHYRLVHRELNPYEPAAALQVYQYVPSPFDVGEVVTATLAFAPGPDRRLELTACRLDSPRLVPGQPVHLTLFWRAATALDQPLRLTLYLSPETGGNSRRWAETAAPGGLPTDLWTPGVVVADRHVLFPLADLSPGDYRLELALHLPNSQPVCPHPTPAAYGGTPSPLLTFGQERGGGSGEAAGGGVRLSGEAECRILLACLYRPAAVSTEPPRPDHPLRLKFVAQADGLRHTELVGYDAPEWALRGEPFRVALYWHAVEPLPADYKVFVHLLAADGRLLAQDDSEPVAWTYPTSRWRAGEYVMDEHWLTLPADAPRGDVRLSVGLYDPTTGDRLPVYDEGGARLPEDRAVLAQIRVY